MRWLHNLLQRSLYVERRIDPWIRPLLDALLQRPGTWIVQEIAMARRRDEKLALAQEVVRADEDMLLDQIIERMRAHMSRDFPPETMERGGNTKTHGVVRGELVVHPDLPAHLRRGIFATERSYPAWVRFGGPGPHTPPDIDDVGVLSIGVKLMGVPGPKLMEDERHTQDLTGISCPTFTTPTARENAYLQYWSGRELPLWYFLGPRPHIADLLMQGLWSKTQGSPLGTAYYSCVPYLLGEGTAIQYAFLPAGQVDMKVERLPRRPSDHYLRENMAKTLGDRDATFTMTVQLQTDPHRMPIEHAGIFWPEKLSPRIPVATLHIPAQCFDSPAQMAFARNLSYNPWHSIAEHRPLGNLNRARRKLYWELARFRQANNSVPHIEPTGAEEFD
ncbi:MULTISPECIES: catalase family protein [unclassified Neorhizobium]|uniref:catalase family protein n=1 Tax=unclassified Neorhizobium TaxID=2629175 RepID=UPI001FF242F0|nr:MULTISPECIES: catalase family protein [unclassified Neorhizobium]MCJ9670071.1 catalase family protein [Neorhizobium sp. SHOUNA12B]MCJ9746056.1 catalase family protein [Neorhizobium sp. SHOUNA12A]